MRFIHYAIATGLGSGYVPKAPGTAGSILGLLIAYFLFRENTLVLVGSTIIVTLLGIISGSYVEKDKALEDPQIVVVDEIAGMWIGLWFVPVEPWLYLIAFGLFRFFDVKKPYPINKLQDLHGGLGIMMDDVMAGVYTLLIMQALLYFL